MLSTYFPAGPFTVLAPNNAAFAKLPKGTVEALLADVPALKKILLRHVIAGKVESADVTAGSIETVGGEIITAGVYTASSGTTVTFTNASGAKATVVAANVQASNGVAHVIDTVI
jgi:transforming growth factor-beta-induced protein